MATKLPTELLIEIFSYLSYSDLHHLSAVNRRFNSIISSSPSSPPPPSLRDALLLSSPIEYVLADGEIFEPHPAFARLHYHPNHDLEDARFNVSCSQCSRRLKPTHYTSKSPQKLLDVPVCHENAVSPAVDRLVLHIAHFSPFEVRKKRGGSGSGALTLEDVMRVVSDSLAQKAGNDLIPPVLMGRYRSRSYITKGQILASEYGRKWTGVNKVEVVDGTVHVKVLCL